MLCSAVLIYGVALTLVSGGDSNSVILDGGFRFTATTDQLIRIEYDENRRFVDERTIVFLRSPPKGVWISSSTLQSSGSAINWTVLNTSRVSVRYQPGPPRAGSVIVTSREDSSYTWSWGDDPAEGNLRGTARTLDSNAETLDLNCHNKVSPTMNNSEQHCTWGLVSRAGWAVVNDTGGPMLPNGWFAPSRNSTDVHVFLHGLNFTGALLDFFYAAGPPALPPRYGLGTMFTRWFNFDSDSVVSLVEDFENHALPLDAFIFDMNWHIFGPWGSFSWNENSYPRLQSLLSWIQKQGLAVGANFHEHDGISTSEKTYQQFCSALGWTPGANIPFDLYNRSYAMAQEDIAIGALASKDGLQGIDFSWIDYQQGEVNTFQQTTIPNINPTIVLNMIRSQDPLRRTDNMRPMILARWGGLGNHRYPLGFSGDQLHSWKGLAFLPYFTSTAANVAFNYWSHDTVGADGANKADDFELGVRWTQVSAFSPVLRFHDKGAGTGNCATNNDCARIVPWDFPRAYFKAIRGATLVRQQLLPYIYTAAWASTTTGHALCRPMYYENPADDALYGLDKQYMFGPDMVMSPITNPSGNDTTRFQQALGAVEWTVFAPKSQQGWVDRLNGDFFNGAASTSTYGIRDVPGFIRQGAVVPLRPHSRGQSSFARAVQPLAALEFRITPAEAVYHGKEASGKATVVDDDGVSLDYLSGGHTETTCEYAFADGKFSFKISQTGDFKGRPSKVTLKLSFPQMPPITVSQADATVEYDHELVGPVATFSNVDLSATFSVDAVIDAAYLGSPGVLPNFVGLLGRVRRARYMKDALDDANVPYGAGRADLTSLVLAATQMSPSFASSLPKLWSSAVHEVAALLASDGTLKNDPRRSVFISKMLRIGNQTAAPLPVSVI